MLPVGVNPLFPRRSERIERAARPKEQGLDGEETPLRVHDLRHTFASHLIVDLGIDVAQVSRILGHARPSITLDTYTHLFDQARHAADLRERMARSDFANLLRN
jgi:integrase